MVNGIEVHCSGSMVVHLSQESLPFFTVHLLQVSGITACSEMGLSIMYDPMLAIVPL